MLIKDLPEPIRILAETRYKEHRESRSLNDTTSVSFFDWGLTQEKYNFWHSINNGNFTPYYAMYGLPEKWCIKCLPEWLDRNPGGCRIIVNKDWLRCFKSFNNYGSGVSGNRFYHNCGDIISDNIKQGYTEITLPDWIAANPEKKEGDGKILELIGTNYIKIDGVLYERKFNDDGTFIVTELPDEKEIEEQGRYNDIPMDAVGKYDPNDKIFDPITKPKHYNSHPSGVECKDIAQHHNFNVGNVFKYIWRQGLKEGESNIKDLMKAKQYLDFEIDRINKFEKSK